MFFNYLSIVNISIYVVCLVLITPFLVVFSSYSPYEYPKFLFYCIGAGMLIFISFFRLFFQKVSFRFLYNSFYLLVIAYVCVVFLANFLGVDSITSFWGSLFRHQGYVLLLANFGLFFVISLQSEKDREVAYMFFQKGVVVISLLLCGFAFWQVFGAFVLHTASIPLYQGRIVGAFGNPNSFGGYLAMLLPFLILGKGKQRVYKICLIMFVIGGIFVTGSRAALLASAIVFIFTGVQFLLQKNVSKVFVKIILAFAFFSLLTLFGLWNVRESPWDNRFIIWQGGWEAFVQRPILGYGQENFQLAFTKFDAYHVDNAHNIFLEIAVSSGIVGLVLFLALFGKAFFQASLPIKMSLLAFLIVAQFNPLSIAQIALFWLLLGLGDVKDL